MTKPINPPIIQSTVYQYETNEEMRGTMMSGDPFFYIRSGNPTVSAVSGDIAALERGESALLFASGMAAVTCTLLALLSSGDHILCHREPFSQTRSLLDAVLARFGVLVSYANANDAHSLRDSIRPNTRIIYIETPSNPLLDVVDIARVASIAKEIGVLLIVDSTNATPVLQRPLDLGASLVLQSGTKYLSGHSDVLCGAVAGPTNLVAGIHKVQKLTGGILDPHAAYLLDRGLKTLSLRIGRICETALQLAEFLSSHPVVAYVRYPYLKNDPGFSIARSQMSGGGGLVSFELKNGLGGAQRFVDALKVIRLATSLGGTESTIEIPYDLKRHREEFEERMGLIRLSVGIEDAILLCDDLNQALESAK